MNNSRLSNLKQHLRHRFYAWWATLLAILAPPVAIPAIFSDADWGSLGSGMTNDVLALAVNGTDLYAGGQFTTAGGVPANYIAKWNGSAWSALGLGMTVNSPSVDALAVNGTNLYASGYFPMAGAVWANSIAEWDGSAWSSLGSGFLGFEYAVCALAVSGTYLYAGGYNFTTAGGVEVNGIAKWDGSAWSALGSGVNGGIYALALSGTNLYAGGWFTTAGGVPASQIAKWDGSAWSALGSGVGGYYVYALAVIGTDIYAGGGFTTAGGVPANHIAKWDGSTWSALGSGVNNSVRALAADALGHLYVGGIFSRAGTKACSNIARATLWQPPILVTQPQSQRAEIATRVQLNADASGSAPLWYRWYFASTNLLSSTTNSQLVLNSVGAGQSGSYQVVVTNLFGSVTSSPALLSVIAQVEHRMVSALTLTGQPGTLLNLDFTAALWPAPSWTTFDHVLLAQTPQWYFDLATPLPTQGFYRAWQAGPGAQPQSLSLPGMVPAITLTGALGSSMRLDYINQFGPIDAWTTNLATVTLTNSPQLYFDTSAIDQPARLYRIVPVP